MNWKLGLAIVFSCVVCRTTSADLLHVESQDGRVFQWDTEASSNNANLYGPDTGGDVLKHEHYFFRSGGVTTELTGGVIGYDQFGGAVTFSNVHDAFEIVLCFVMESPFSNVTSSRFADIERTGGSGEIEASLFTVVDVDLGDYENNTGRYDFEFVVDSPDTQQTFSTGAADEDNWTIGTSYDSLIGGLRDGSTTNLDGQSNAGPGDVVFAGQWDFTSTTIGNSNTYSAFEFYVTPPAIPEPGTIGCVAIFGTLISFRRNRMVCRPRGSNANRTDRKRLRLPALTLA